MFKNCILICVVFTLLRCGQSFDYCSKRAPCRKYKHFMCHPDSVPELDKYLAHVPLSRKVRHLILDMHNKLRAKIANGEVLNQAGVAFPNATRLREFVWNTELANMAKVHASRCNMEYDYCHNTAQFKRSGQNLACHSTGHALESIEKMILSWYDEKDLVPDPATYADHLLSNWQPTGHFSLLINEMNAHLGCSVALCEDANAKESTKFYMTCNYGYTNMIRGVIYQKGNASAIDCQKWATEKSSNYLGLCANNGRVIDD